jgi:hypothetical protein
MTAPHPVLKKFLPPGTPKSPSLAVLIGVLTGEIVALVVGGLRAFRRAQSSNRHLTASIMRAVAVGSEG